jgi:hypothetical protein
MSVLAWLEADMARHMLVEFPLLMGCGAALERFMPRAVEAFVARFDALGLTGWTLATLVVLFWMIPSALDAALGQIAVDTAKYLSLAAAGFALASSMRRSPLLLEAFFVGNFVWMSATIGLLYQESESRLCLNYLTNSQRDAGRGLVAYALVALVAWFAWRGRSRVELSAATQETA